MKRTFSIFLGTLVVTAMLAQTTLAATNQPKTTSSLVNKTKTLDVLKKNMKKTKRTVLKTDVRMLVAVNTGGITQMPESGF